MSFLVIVIIILSNISTSFITYHCMKRNRGDAPQTNMLTSTGQVVYEDVSNIHPREKEFNMDDNSAYGPLNR